ncbi:peptidase S53 [Paraburkholderia monticola]|uniref:Peptidase S53 n=1 Tax=Paraburkholderia monticola TaxID=1399968 RepID=A0A149PBA7_9BURK|nr:S53 family peptidase [Paraburkholderia monticola]KXU82308.1 peptidase S53 [Paraburkholderia monticola]
MTILRPAKHSLVHVRYLALALAPLLLFGCGGGSGDPAASSSTTSANGAPTSSSSTSSLSLSPLSSTAASTTVTPAFYTAPVVLNAPSDIDSASPYASAHQLPVSQPSGSAMAAVSLAQLTPQTIAKYAAAASPSASSSKTVTTYTPAQIRAAYGLPALPSSWSNLSAAQSAQMGAGQTIYLIDAMSDPNIAAELAMFNQKFGLPSCTTTSITPSASLPLAAAGTSSCQFSVVYSTTSGTMTSTAPTYNSRWATEIALDVQWAHATAPLARLVLIEAPDASTSSLLQAINLANAMGPGVVSMSFGAAEGSWTASVDSAFSSANMTYVAATGDNGTGVEWPSISPHVLAVGGTQLTYDGAARSETVWSGTGGGVSKYTSAPAYQNPSVPGMGTLSMRSVGDVSFNADPYTGQYVAIMAPGSSSASWYSVGGTSLATPQWAGITAIANALRAQDSLGALGLAQMQLYGTVSANASLYAANFYDVTSGSDGACSSCSAHTGYDQPSGLGTPNVGSLLSTLGATSAQAPVVAAATVKGVAGSALSFTMAASAADALRWSLSNAPQGMSIDSSGQVAWAQPVAGSYAVTVKATDTVTGLSASAIANVTIVSASAPIVEAATIAGQTKQALAYQVDVSALDPVQYSMSGAPAGMSISSSGMIRWPSPVAGTYGVNVTATDTKTGQSGSATLSVQISAATSGPVITASAINGKAGSEVSGVIGIADPGARYVNVNIKGVPAGMAFSLSGQGILADWPRPVAGTYTLILTAVDSAGLSSQANLVVTISAK